MLDIKNHSLASINNNNKKYVSSLILDKVLRIVVIKLPTLSTISVCLCN